MSINATYTTLQEKKMVQAIQIALSETATGIVEVNNFCKDKLKLDMAICMDSGHMTAINGAEAFAKINTAQKQGYALQGI